jgi:starvation-inducible DNA-binding protein
MAKKQGKTPARKAAPQLSTQTDLSNNAIPEIAEALNGLVADSYALYTKTKNFHWHVSGPHFRDYHLLFDEQATEIFATVDELAERVRKLGAKTVHSIGEIARLQTIKDNDKDYVAPKDMLIELMNDNKLVIKRMRSAMRSPTAMRMWRRRRSWKTSSTRPKSGTGSCSRPAKKGEERFAKGKQNGP